MRQSEAQAQAAMEYAERKWLDPPDDGPVGTCPTCDGDTYNFEPHGCDGDCPRGCRGMVPAECDTCKVPCACCGEKRAGHNADARGWCPECQQTEECSDCGKQVSVVGPLTNDLCAKCAQASEGRKTMRQFMYEKFNEDERWGRWFEGSLVTGCAVLAAYCFVRWLAGW